MTVSITNEDGTFNNNIKIVGIIQATNNINEDITLVKSWNNAKAFKQIGCFNN